MAPAQWAVTNSTYSTLARERLVAWLRGRSPGLPQQGQ